MRPESEMCMKKAARRCGQPMISIFRKIPDSRGIPDTGPTDNHRLPCCFPCWLPPVSDCPDLAVQVQTLAVLIQHFEDIVLDSIHKINSSNKLR